MVGGYRPTSFPFTCCRGGLAQHHLAAQAGTLTQFFVRQLLSHSLIYDWQLRWYRWCRSPRRSPSEPAPASDPGRRSPGTERWYPAHTIKYAPQSTATRISGQRLPFWKRSKRTLPGTPCTGPGCATTRPMRSRVKMATSTVISTQYINADSDKEDSGWGAETPHTVRIPATWPALPSISNVSWFRFLSLLCGCMPLFTGILSLILPVAKKETVKIPLHIKTAGRLRFSRLFSRLIIHRVPVRSRLPLIRCRLDRLHRIILNLLYPARQEHGIYPGQIRPKPFVWVGLMLFPRLVCRARCPDPPAPLRFVPDDENSYRFP